jgi:hypothetical protein
LAYPTETYVSGDVVRTTTLLISGKGPSSELILFLTPSQLSLRRDDGADDDDDDDEA